MAVLIAFALASAAAPRSVAAASRRFAPAGLVDRWAPLIREAADRAAIPEAWIRRVLRAESAGRTTLRGQPIVSRTGAMGLMQLMPATWAAMRARLGLGTDPFDPHDNIVAGAAYLRMMYDRFGYPGLFGAYNAGPGRYAAFLSGRSLPVETVGYLVKVAGTGPLTNSGAVPPAHALGPGIFIVLHRTQDMSTAVLPAASALFVVRRDGLAESAARPAPEVGE